MTTRLIERCGSLLQQQLYAIDLRRLARSSGTMILLKGYVTGTKSTATVLAVDPLPQKPHANS